MISLEDDQINTTAAAIEATGLDWEVTHGELQGKCFDRESMQFKWREMNNHKCVYRTDTGYPLGNSIVGKGFELVQNSEAFNCFDEILQQHQVKFTSGGWYHDGGSVFLQAKLPQGIVFDNGDELERYLLIAQGHTGQQSLTMRFTHIRPSCSNTLIAALSDSTYSFSLKHTATIKERIDDGIKFMSKGLTHLEKAERKFHVMSKLHLSEREQINFLKMAYDRPIDEELKDWRAWPKLEPIFHAPRGGEYTKGTLWNPYNVLTQYEDHHSRINRDRGQTEELSPSVINESRQVRALFGAGTINRKVKAFKIADKVINGDLDLKTGRTRDYSGKKEWTSTVAGIAGAIGVQHLMPF